MIRESAFFILFIMCCFLSCKDRSEIEKDKSRIYVKTIKVLTVEGDTAIINTGIGTTMTIEIVK